MKSEKKDVHTTKLSLLVLFTFAKELKKRIEIMPLCFLTKKNYKNKDIYNSTVVIRSFPTIIIGMNVILGFI